MVDVHIDYEISHSNWPKFLKDHYDKEGFDVLEIGSRKVTGSTFREMFEKANYVGFDYHPGENVDVIGDAHKLGTYFDKKFDLIFSSAVFEHLVMPWKVALEIIGLLKTGGVCFTETHYSFSNHERPWHFFQFSEEALRVLFPEKLGMKCIKMNVSNPIEGYFTNASSPYLRGQKVMDMWCHSECLVQKVFEVKELSWNDVLLEDLVGKTEYPENEDVYLRKLHHEEMDTSYELVEDNSVVGCLDSAEDGGSMMLLKGWFLGKRKELEMGERVIVSGNQIYTPLNVPRNDIKENAKELAQFIPIDEKIGFQCRIEKDEAYLNGQSIFVGYKVDGKIYCTNLLEK